MKKYVILDTTNGSKKDLSGIRELSSFFGLTVIEVLRLLKGSNAYVWGDKVILAEGADISRFDYSVNKTAQITNALPTKVVISFAKTLNTAIVPAVDRFTLAGKTISGVTVGNSSVTLTVSVAYVFGDVVVVSYAVGALPLTYKEDGSKVLSFTNLAVVNNVEE